MAELLDPKELVSFKELFMSEVIQSEAMINLLDKEGIISKRELLEEMKRVKAALPKSEIGRKTTSKITKEEALEIAGRETGVLSCIGITDEYHPGWMIYAADRLADCWYVTFDPSLVGTTLGPSYMVAVSKKDGEILFSGVTGGD
jgi:hypothetical protein